MGAETSQAISILGVEPTAQAIRAQYQPETRYRVSERSHLPSSDFHGFSVEAPLFVLKGAIEISFEDDPERFIEVREGEYLLKPSGGYRMRVGDPSGAKIVWVLEVTAPYTW